MLARLICALYRGHFWLNTRERFGVCIESTCIHCGKVLRYGVEPLTSWPRPPAT